MQKTTFFIFFILTIILFSCKDNDKENKIYNDFFIKSREVGFDRGKHTKDYLYYQYVDNDTLEFIVNLDKEKNILCFFDIKNGNNFLNLKIPFNKQISAFFFSNFNSIFFIPSYSFDILEFKEMSIIDTIFCLNPMDSNFIEKANKYDIGSNLEFFPMVLSPLLVLDSVFYVQTSIDPSKDVNSLRPFFIISTKKGMFDINTKNGRFSENMTEKGKTYFPYNMIIPFTINNKKEFIISYFYDNAIYIFKNDKLYKKINAKSNFIKELPKPIKISQLNDEKIVNSRGKSFGNTYTNIKYDKYRDLYYRLALYINKENKSYDFSIIIINNNFEVIGEQIFNESGLCSTVIITREGIMLLNLDDLSGVTRYSVFKINEKYLKK